MKANSVLACAVVLASLAGAGTAARADAWDDAQAAFSEFDDRRAFVHLRRAAEEGDARARVALGLALRFGERLYPGALKADAKESAHWLATAVPDANPLPQSMVPPAKRTRSGRYLSADQAWSLKSALGARVLFVDVRTRAEAGYVGMPDAVDALIPYLEHDEFMSDWDEARATFRATPNGRFAEDMARALAQKGLGRDAVIVLICRSGDRSAKAADLLTELGHTQVHSVVEGFEGDLSAQGRRSVNGWKNAGLPWSFRLDRAKAQFARH
ncbi:MAG: hypothetical protein JNN03_11145 [Rubrivivax sp.]|nr:hypothetical protein [Rubrivivax sp.]